MPPRGGSAAGADGAASEDSGSPGAAVGSRGGTREIGAAAPHQQVNQNDDQNNDCCFGQRYSPILSRRSYISKQSVMSEAATANQIRNAIAVSAVWECFTVAP